MIDLKSIPALESLSIADNFEDRISCFYKLLIEENQKHNLTRITSYDDFINKHVVDSLLIAQAWPDIQQGNYKIVDIGCGGGIPGLILAMALPNISVMEIDSVAKKIDCVNMFIDHLQIDNAKAVHGNARELSRQEAHNLQYDIIIARAVAESHKLIKECKLFLKPESRMIFYKTPKQMNDEQTLVEREAKKAKLAVSRSKPISLGDAGDRQFWLLEKE